MLEASARDPEAEKQRAAEKVSAIIFRFTFLPPHKNTTYLLNKFHKKEKSPVLKSVWRKVFSFVSKLFLSNKQVNCIQFSSFFLSCLYYNETRIKKDRVKQSIK
ncbi:hypothetical protein PMEGAPR54_01200 [Priestia megaterium]